MVNYLTTFCTSGNVPTIRHSKMETYLLITLLTCCLCNWKRPLCIQLQIRLRNTCSDRTLNKILTVLAGHLNRIWAQGSRLLVCWRIKINRWKSINSSWIVNLLIIQFKNKKTISLISAINQLIMAICSPLSNSRWKNPSQSRTSFIWSQKPSLRSPSYKTTEKLSTTLLMTPTFSTISRW